ncbi:hypothetical protein [uncultured Flavobacterium sp.]|uniref:hypothetical protein n=1 Tax=uncultured Flavobacterium sp. TaxID=165435 RepID=UPI0030C87C93
MNKIIYIVLILVFISCKTSTDSSNLRFAYTENYKIEEGEKSVSLNKEIVDEYEKINGDLAINIPLNRYVYSTDYKVYIGVSIDNTIKEVAEAYSNDEDLKLIDSKKVKEYYNLFCKKDNQYMVKTLYNEKKEKLPIVLTLVGKDSILIRKIYDENKLIKKVE